MDTRPPFSQYVYRKQLINTNKDLELFQLCEANRFTPLQLEQIVKNYIYHDEHVMLACSLEYLSDLYCICKDEQDYTKNNKHYCVITFDTPSRTLNQFCAEAITADYILDIDLDFFNSRLEFEEYKVLLSVLIKKAKLITIAKEKFYFNQLKRDNHWNNEDALKSLLDLIKEILKPSKIGTNL